jgi:hypothetical protein
MDEAMDNLRNTTFDILFYKANSISVVADIFFDANKKKKYEQATINTLN